MHRRPAWQRWGLIAAVGLIDNTAFPAHAPWWHDLLMGMILPALLTWVMIRPAVRLKAWMYMGSFAGTLQLLPVLDGPDWWWAAGNYASALIAFLIWLWRRRRDITARLAAGRAREKAIIAGMVKTMRERRPRLPAPVPVPS